MGKNKIHVRICGVEYTLLSTEEPEYVHKVAYLVDKKMSEIMGENSRLNSAMASLLTAINLADEYFKDKKDSDNLRQKIAEYNKLSEEYKDRYIIAETELKEANEKIKELEAKLNEISEKKSVYYDEFDETDE